MIKFVFTGKFSDVLLVLRALAELEWELPDLASLLDGQVIQCSD